LKHSDDNAYDDGYDYDAGATNWDKYTVLSFVGAIVFVFNAAWDMYWCYYGQERERENGRRRLSKGKKATTRKKKRSMSSR